MKITLPTEKRIVLRQAETINVTDITIVTITDSPSQKRVICTTKELGVVVLWEGGSYDTIGQWTDTDVALRIKEIYQ